MSIWDEVKKEIKSKDGREYFVDEENRVLFIRGKRGISWPYIWDEKYQCSTNVSGVYKYEYLRRKDNNGEISWN